MAIKPIYFLTVALSLFMMSATATAQKKVLAEKSSYVSPLLIGQVLPDASVLDLDGKATTLKAIAASKPTVFVVFRGGWCPYCSRQLSQLKKSIDALQSIGWQVVGLSPDTPEQLRKATKDLDLPYILYSDQEATAIVKLGLAYKAGLDEFFTKEFQDKWVETHPKAADKGVPVLPVPAVFLVHRSGLVVYQYVNVDFKVRLSGEVLLTAAQVYAE